MVNIVYLIAGSNDAERQLSIILVDKSQQVVLSVLLQLLVYVVSPCLFTIHTQIYIECMILVFQVFAILVKVIQQRLCNLSKCAHLFSLDVGPWIFLIQGEDGCSKTGRLIAWIPLFSYLVYVKSHLWVSLVDKFRQLSTIQIFLCQLLVFKHEMCKLVHRVCHLILRTIVNDAHLWYILVCCSLVFHEVLALNPSLYIGKTSTLTIVEQQQRLYQRQRMCAESCRHRYLLILLHLYELTFVLAFEYLVKRLLSHPYSHQRDTERVEVALVVNIDKLTFDMRIYLWCCIFLCSCLRTLSFTISIYRNSKSEVAQHQICALLVYKEEVVGLDIEMQETSLVA